MDFSREFIAFACDQGVLRFGEFKTKAGRLSPYFFNAGLFSDGQSLGRLAHFYARAIIASGIGFDVLFGPAYKGIPLVGAPLVGRVLVIDDVISAGTSVRESVELIRAAGATPAGVVIALDRQERGQDSRSAVQEVEASYGIPVIAVATLVDLIAYLHGNPALERVLPAVTRYREQYGMA